MLLKKSRRGGAELPFGRVVDWNSCRDSGASQTPLVIKCQSFQKAYYLNCAPVNKRKRPLIAYVNY